MRYRIIFTWRPAVYLMAVVLVTMTLAQAMARTMEERYRDADGYSRKYAEGCFLGQVTPFWINGGKQFWYFLQTPRGGEFFIVDSQSGAKKPFFNQEKMAVALSRELKKEIKPYSLPVLNIEMMGEDWMEVRAEGQTFYYNFKKEELTRQAPDGNSPAAPSGGARRQEPASPSVSPDGRYDAFIREHNVWLKDRKENREVRLSEDGSPGDGYSLPVQWAPDSSCLVCCRKTTVPQREVTLVESSPRDQLQPRTKSISYTKPGDALPVTRPVIFAAVAGSGREVLFDSPENQYEVGEVKWAGDGSYFTFSYNKRGHGEFIIYRVDRDSVQARPVVKEVSPTFINYTKLFRHDLEKEKEILWISERDGWRHLYLIDSESGKVKRQVTRGEWIVKSVQKVDEKNRTVRFISCGREPGENPYLEKICTVSLDGGEVTCLTPGKADHAVTFSPDEKFFVDNMSRADMAPRCVLREGATGRVVSELEQSDVSPALKKGWKYPEVFCAKGRDGKTDIWGLIVRPSDFEKGKKYPVIEYIYAGPHDSHVPRRFAMEAEGRRYTELGFVVVMIDGMGTANRSKAFHDVCWKNLKDAGFPDRIAWMKSAVKKYPELDLKRVGIYGMSAGGQNAMGAVLFHPEFYKAAVAACGCHDNRMDKIWWNEQWMGYPVGKHYDECSNATNAGRLQGALMLIGGELDDNVDPSSTVQVVNALIKADKEFDYVLIPGARHTMGEKFGERKRRDFFIRHLMGETPRNWNSGK